MICYRQALFELILNESNQSVLLSDNEYYLISNPEIRQRYFHNILQKLLDDYSSCIANSKCIIINHLII